MRLSKQGLGWLQYFDLSEKQSFERLHNAYPNYDWFSETEQYALVKQPKTLIQLLPE